MSGANNVRRARMDTGIPRSGPPKALRGPLIAEPAILKEAVQLAKAAVVVARKKVRHCDLRIAAELRAVEQARYDRQIALAGVVRARYELELAQRRWRTVPLSQR